MRDERAVEVTGKHTLGGRLNFAAKAMRGYVDHHLSAAGSSFAVWTALFALNAKGPLIQRELAELLNVEGPTLTRHLARMEAQGLVERRRMSADRRAAVVRLTADRERIANDRHVNTVARLVAIEKKGRALSTAEQADKELSEKILDEIAKSQRNNSKMDEVCDPLFVGARTLLNTQSLINPELRTEVVDKASDAQVASDLDATAQWALTQGGLAAKMGVIGFCWGGRQVWLYAMHNPNLKAAAAFYGPLAGTPTVLQPVSVLSQVVNLKVPVLGAYGGKDAGISMQDIDTMRASLAQGTAVDKASRIDVYPDAGHGFHADYRPSYNKADAELAWQRAMDWFASHGLS